MAVIMYSVSLLFAFFSFIRLRRFDSKQVGWVEHGETQQNPGDQLKNALGETMSENTSVHQIDPVRCCFFKYPIRNLS